MSDPIAFRNLVRYVREPEKNVPLYEASRGFGFKLTRTMGGMAILQNEMGLKLVLHEGEPRATNSTALGFTMTGAVAEARAFVEKAGWILLRAPDAEDQGFFYIYGDLDGNPINLVGDRRHS